MAANMNVAEMTAHIGVDSLAYVTIDGLYRAVGVAEGRDPQKPRYCDACFSGDYPVVPADMIKKGFQLKTAAE